MSKFTIEDFDRVASENKAFSLSRDSQIDFSLVTNELLRGNSVIIGGLIHELLDFSEGPRMLIEGKGLVDYTFKEFLDIAKSLTDEESRMLKFEKLLVSKLTKRDAFHN